jgi:hypothetical protein
MDAFIVLGFPPSTTCVWTIWSFYLAHSMDDFKLLHEGFYCVIFSSDFYLDYWVAGF